jgi:hypothetical protein
MSNVIGRPAAKVFAAAIFLMGLVRFMLTVSGLPDSTVKYFSMTAVIIAGIFYFALTTATHKDRLKASYVLVIPYMVVEISALGYTWASGHPTIFHAKEYNLGASLPAHTFGHFVGGLTWEPLFSFVLMEFIWLVGQGVYRFTGTRHQSS